MNSEQWVVKASDNTDYVLAYADGIYCVTDKYGSVICEFIKCNTENNDEWHVVADGDLPKESGSYIVTQATHSLKEYDKILRLDTVLADFSSGKWLRSKHLEVIAWKELPEEYKPEEGSTIDGMH